MNMRLACDLCGHQPCMCQEFECEVCDGTGDCWNNADPTSGQRVDCEACKGEGWVKCNGPLPDGGCAYQRCGDGTLLCHCEAAWERQQEDNASEPPPSARERQEIAQHERDALRSGRPV